MIPLLPMDVIVVDGFWYNPIHLPIMWRSLDASVHSCVVIDPSANLWSPECKGVLRQTPADYVGRTISVHRYNRPFDPEKLVAWCNEVCENAEGYDFKAWLGFATGFKSLMNDEKRWYCAELPYWAFHENGYKLTSNVEAFIYPRFFRFNPLFDEIWRGKIQ